MSEQERYLAARERAGRLAGLYRHATVYVLVNVLLIGINLVATPGGIWFIWPLLGWGLGLAIHAAGVLSGDRFLGPEWQERKARELVERGSRS